MSALPKQFEGWPANPVTESELQSAREEFAECQRDIQHALARENVARANALLARKQMLGHRCEWLVVRWIAQGCEEGRP
jgi:hypothetical protein